MTPASRLLARPARVLALAAFAPLACLLLAGCRVSSTSNNGKNDNVEIGTPFGSMHVKTNDAANPAALGLAVYPGAVPVKEDSGHSGSAADINMKRCIWCDGLILCGVQAGVH